jgi:hypothetical protein
VERQESNNTSLVMKLIQNGIFKRDEFEILDNGLHYSKKKFFDHLEYDNPFEDISEKTVYQSKEDFNDRLIQRFYHNYRV